MGAEKFAILKSHSAITLLGLWCAILAMTGPGSASPWTRDKSELLIISRADYFKADLPPVDKGSRLVESRFQRLESNTYSEFGLTSDIMIGGKLVYGTTWLTRGAETETATGFSEIESFGQYQVFRRELDAGAIRVAATIPSRFSSGVRDGLQTDGVDIDASLLYGRNLVSGDVKIFSTIEAGFRKRTGDAADQVRLQSTIGLEPDDTWLILIDAFATLSLRNETPGGADFDIMRIQPSVLYQFSRRWGVQVGVTEEISGRNLALGRTFFIGLWSRF